MKPLTTADGEWIAPTITTDLVVIAPRPYPGIEADSITIEPNVYMAPCAITGPDPRTLCPLEKGHVGPHWLATRDLYATIAPVRLWAHTYGAE